jgi:hypothetical protein
MEIEITAALWNALVDVVPKTDIRPLLHYVHAKGDVLEASDGHTALLARIEGADMPDVRLTATKAPKAAGSVTIEFGDELTGAATLTQGGVAVALPYGSEPGTFPDVERATVLAIKDADPAPASVRPAYLARASKAFTAILKAADMKDAPVRLTTYGMRPALLECRALPDVQYYIMPMREPYE